MLLPLFPPQEQFPASTDPKRISNVSTSETIEVTQTTPIRTLSFLLSNVFSPKLPSLMLLTSHSHCLTTFIFSLFMATLWGPCGTGGVSITCGSMSSSDSLYRFWNDGFTTTAPRKSLLGARTAELGRCGIFVSSTVHARCSGILVSSNVQDRWGWTLNEWNKDIV